jgi:hypothetical protein
VEINRADYCIRAADPEHDVYSCAQCAQLKSFFLRIRAAACGCCLLYGGQKNTLKRKESDVANDIQRAINAVELK